MTAQRRSLSLQNGCCIVISPRMLYRLAAQSAKDKLWSLPDGNTAEEQSEDVVIIAGDLNGHLSLRKTGTAANLVSALVHATPKVSVSLST